LRREDDQGVAVVRGLAVREHLERLRDSDEEVLAVPALMIVDAVRRLPREGRHRAVLRREAVLHGEGIPWLLLLMLADAVCVAAGMRHGRHAHCPGRGTSDVGHDEPERSADRAVRAPAGPEAAGGAVDVDGLTYGPVDDEERRREVGRGGDAMQVEG